MSPYDENWLLDCLAVEIRLNDPRTTSVAKECVPRPRELALRDPVDARREVLQRRINELRQR